MGAVYLAPAQIMPSFDCNCWQLASQRHQNHPARERKLAQLQLGLGNHLPSFGVKVSVACWLAVRRTHFQQEPGGMLLPLSIFPLVPTLYILAHAESIKQVPRLQRD